jgi:hypothetical protein
MRQLLIGSAARRLVIMAVLLSVSVTLCWSGAAQGALRLKFMAVGASRVYTDGARWAAYEPTVGRTRIIDDLTGRSSNRPNPTGCAGEPSGLKAVGSGELLYRCTLGSCPLGGCVVWNQSHQSAYLDARYQVEDAVSGALHPVVGAGHLPLEPEEPGFGGEGVGYSELTAVGGRWVEGVVGGPGSAGRSVYFLNWHTGKLRREPKPNDPAPGPGDLTGGYNTIDDLSGPEPLRAMCSPFTRTSPVYNAGVDFAYGFPFALESGGAGLTLRKCGSSQRYLLPGTTDEFQLGGGVITWRGSSPPPKIEESTYATRVDLRARTWHDRIYKLQDPTLTPLPPRFLDFGLQHTSTTVYASGGQFGGAGSCVIFAARLPKP